VKQYFSILVGLAFLVVLLPACEAGSSDTSADIVSHYVTASDQAPLRGVSQEVEFEAKLPKLQKEGKLHAFRFITKVGQIRYVADKFVGDSSVKKDVIARYMSAETQAVEQQNPSDSAISPTNYKFKYKGRLEQNGRVSYIFGVNPRKKRVGLFKGELWIDAATYLPLRESGRLVRTPSIFLRKVDFVREYEIIEGHAVPKHIQSTIETRFWGPAELNIDFHNLSFHPETDVSLASSPAADLQ
jgi:hypothetical protein